MSGKIFVVMPSEDFPQSKEKKEIIRSCALACGWTVLLPKYDRDKPSFDLRSTLATLRNINLVLVDLSDERPSCYYELGMAEALGLQIAVFAREGTPIHQTSLRANVHFFADLNEYRNKISQKLGGKKATSTTKQ